MKVGIEKYAMFIIKSGKRQMKEEKELPNQERISMFGEKETDKYYEILEVDTIKKLEMKEKKLKNVYLRRMRKFPETKLCNRNRMKVINSWTSPLYDTRNHS